jgi:2-dehydropantoate 2-reductase
MQVDIKQSQHLVFGAGLIGCYLGGVLSYLGLNTRLVCRPVIKNKLQQGIKLTDYLEHVSNNIALQFADQLESSPAVSETSAIDFLWLTVKCTGIEQAVRDIAPFVSANTVILCCQNGLGSEALLKTHFANNQVLRVMVPFNVVELNPGHYHRGSQGSLTLEYSPSSQASIEALAKAMQCDFLPVALSQNMSALLWAKLQLNLGNSINALADIPVKAMLQQRGYRLVIARLMRELLAVTDALSISLPKVTTLPAHWLPRVLSLPDFLFARVANSMLAVDPNVRTSMWWDVSQGKETEIDFLNGAIVEQAELLGLQTPANKKIIELIKALHQKNDVNKAGAINANDLLTMLG